MAVRKCRVFVDGEAQEATFHQFGGHAIYGEDNEPRLVTVAIVELADGQVKQFPPEKIKFIDKPGETT